MLTWQPQSALELVHVKKKKKGCEIKMRIGPMQTLTTHFKDSFGSIKLTNNTL